MKSYIDDRDELPAAKRTAIFEGNTRRVFPRLVDVGGSVDAELRS